MKRKKFATVMFIAALSSVAVLGGCGGKQTDTLSAAAQTAEAAANAQDSAKTQAQAADQAAAKTQSQASDQTAAAAQNQAKTADQAASQAQTAGQAAAGAQAQAADAAKAGAASVATTLEQAQKTALADAGFDIGSVVIKKAGQEMDDGILKYEIDFFAADTKYEYDIDANTGAILSKESEPMDAEDYAEMNALAGTAVKGAVSAVTEDSALEIALKDAGVAQNNITQVRTHVDFDDDYGKNIIEVEFNVGTTEYSYDIDPDTGAILASEKEIDD